MQHKHSTPQIHSDSYFEVAFASFHESDASAEIGNGVFYERLSRLEVGGHGAHFLRAGSLGANVDMLVQDYPDKLSQFAAKGELREAVVVLSSVIHHYVFDMANDQMICVRNELATNRRGDIIQTPKTPVFLVERDDEFTEITRCVGEQYQKWLGNRLLRMELLSDDGNTDRFLKDTELFVSDRRVHVQPKIYEHHFTSDE